MARYTVIARREGRLWSLEVPQVPGALSMVRRLDQAEEHIREAIGFVLDVPEDSFDVEVMPQLPEGWVKLIGEAQGLRTEAERAVSTAAAASRDAVTELTAAGLSVRDTGRLLGVSPQRVSQLANS